MEDEEVKEWKERKGRLRMEINKTGVAAFSQPKYSKLLFVK